ncbi:MAG: tRNA pseudouridine(55) synthase TruB, partial [Desulfobacterales bacterium]|nr:tRNA pseudouridine(55) synthase TruB [Desulfobacterales bacterium]
SAHSDQVGPDPSGRHPLTGVKQVASEMDLDGILVVDKPEGISSARVVSRVKKAAGARKAGHAGTLDPFATGVLVCCLNRATRLARFFLDSEKRYRALMTLGVETDTQDATGKVVATCDPGKPDITEIRAAAEAFRGRIHQQPPAFSALKHQGVPLYKLARKGTPIQKPPREVQIRSIEVVSIDLPQIELDVTCSAGTYIRTLCADIGGRLGCGGHLKTLRRLKSSGFSIEEALTLEQIEQEAQAGSLAARILPMASALRSMPAAVADRQMVEKISFGRTITTSDLAGPAKGAFKVVDSGDRLVAVLEAGNDPDRYTYCGVFTKE